jgi:signal transduction histidine kinase
MRTGKVSAIWRNERLGLSMIAASLVVIVLIVGLLFTYQQESETDHIRQQGVSLARVLSSIPYSQMLPGASRSDVLSLLQHSQANRLFAYLAVVDPQGNPVNEVTAPGVIAPAAAVPSTPASWMGERTLASEGDSQSFLEFHAPLLADGDLAGYVRLGYFQPGIGLHSDQLPFLATLALPVFLLTPLFYFLIKHEIRPLRRANEQLDTLIEQGNYAQGEISGHGELADFVRRFNRFIDVTRDRIAELESEQASLLTSTKLLSYRRDRVETVLLSLPDAVVVLDESGAACMANDRVSTLLGIEQDAIRGSKTAEWCDIPEVIEFLGNHEGKIIRGRHSESVDFVPPDAPEKTITVSAYPLFAPRDGSRILGTLVVFRDTTAEQLARRSSEDFVAHVAHELKTPLNVLAMYSEALHGEDGQTEAFRVEATNVIRDEVERMSMLINNILSITKIEMGSLNVQRQRVKLRDLLNDAFETVARSSRGEDLEFHLDLPREIGAVSVDKDLLRIAINNLLTNAIKYNRPGGSVELVAEEYDDTVRIMVRDTGVGIAPEERDKIFNKFYRSDKEAVRNKSGHGLGLALAREIVQLHHGTLSANSEPGQGSEFVIELSKNADLLKQAV